MSTTYSIRVAENCINGDTEHGQNWDSNLCCTNTENTPWLAIDFGQSVDVKSVTIYNRKEVAAKAARFRNAEVRVTDILPVDGSVMFTGGKLLGTFTGPGTSSQVIHIHGLTGIQGRCTRH
jgi:hypothetical protein